MGSYLKLPPPDAEEARRKLREDVQDLFETLRLQSKAVTEAAAETPVALSLPPPAPPAGVTIHPGSVKVVRWMLRNEKKYEFFAVKFLREKVFATDPMSQDGLQAAIQTGMLEVYHLPNPADSAHPTKACRLNRHHPSTADLVRREERA